MKAILVFDMDEPADRDAHYLAIKGGDMFSVLWDFDQELRKRIKYAPDDKDTSELQEVRDCLYRLLDEKGVSFDAVM